jgi:succinate dehydrogenase hydrophobic anchor subunit
MSKRWLFLIITTIILIVLFVVYIVFFLLPAQKVFRQADQTLDTTDQALKRVCGAIISESASVTSPLVIPAQSVQLCREVLS